MDIPDSSTTGGTPISYEKAASSVMPTIPKHLEAKIAAEKNLKKEVAIS